MEFRISDSFASSLANLTSEEQKAVKMTAFDLQINPENPGHSFHKLDRAQDKNFWSVRVNRDIRIIVHRSKSSLLLCYVNHHDDAYKWAERRKLETHPKTGAAQLVEIRERVEEVRVPYYVYVKTESPPKQLLFDKISDDELLDYGVPPEWLADVKTADEDSILELADHLPSEASEALIEIAVGGTPEPSVSIAPRTTDPFDHPDAQRRFRVMSDVEELERALDFPWEKWMVFLHPAQQELVEKDFNGPARVSGSAGTGKTIVALHRAVHLARQNPESRVLLTTFTDALANALKQKLKYLIDSTPRLAERLEIHSMDAIALRLHRFNAGRKHLLKRQELSNLVSKCSSEIEGLRFSKAFVFEEWLQVVDAWQIYTWEEYRDVRRLGRKSRLVESQRKILWSLFEKVNSELERVNSISMAGIYLALTEELDEKKNNPFDFVVVDEAQDISIPQLKFLSALGSGRPNALFFAGDLGQRIFQQAFSWKSLGVDIRGRSKNLHVNYRTSHQIKMQVDRLLGPRISDVDGNVEDRSGTVSVFNGPQPSIHNFNSYEEEVACVSDWLKSLQDEGIKPREIGVIVRSESEIVRAESAIKQSGLQYKLLDNHIQLPRESVALCTMPLAKGLEFKAVVVMACDDEVVPSQERIEGVADNADLEEIYDTERHLLYVACTRARDRLLVTSGEVPSEFLEDLKRNQYRGFGNE